MKEIYSFESIINEPIHGRKFYTQEKIELLNEKLIEIYNSLNIEKLDRNNQIKVILEYVKNNVGYRKSYFDCFTGKVDSFNYQDTVYRTAYGSLVLGEGMCAGYAEALRVILDLYGIKSYTLLSKLPLERKKLLHYVVVVENEEEPDNYFVLDPESEQYCIRKELDFNDYIENSIYMLPNSIFTDDVVGKDGAGMLAEEYIKIEGLKKVKGTKNLSCLIKEINSKKYKYTINKDFNN